MKHRLPDVTTYRPTPWASTCGYKSTIKTITAATPNSKIVYRDLAATPISHLSGEYLGAGAVADGRARPPPLPWILPTAFPRCRNLWPLTLW